MTTVGGFCTTKNLCIWYGEEATWTWTRKRADMSLGESSHLINYVWNSHQINKKKILALALIEVFLGRAWKPQRSDQSHGETVGRRPPVSTQHFSSKSWCFCFLGLSTFLLHALTEWDKNKTFIHEAYSSVVRTQEKKKEWPLWVN